MQADRNTNLSYGRARLVRAGSGHRYRYCIAEAGPTRAFVAQRGGRRWNLAFVVDQVDAYAVACRRVSVMAERRGGVVVAVDYEPNQVTLRIAGDVERETPPDDVERPTWSKCKGCPLPAVCKLEQACAYSDDDGRPS